ncbi:MAG: hypothetical protein ACM3KR_09810 [Deltaproteobacteria bacterium]
MIGLKINSELKNRINIDLYFFIYLVFTILVFLNDVGSFINYAFKSIVINEVMLPVIFLIIIIFSARRFFIITNIKLNYFDISVLAVIIVLTCLRIALPDKTFDTLNYHIFVQQYNFSDSISDNFLPGGAGTFALPLGDRMFYVFRMILGYRAGTVLNTLVLVLIYLQIQSIIKNYAAFNKINISRYLTSLLPFAVISTEYILMNLSTYMTDLLFIPFLLELLRIILFVDSYNKKYLCYFSLLFGFTIALKLTSITIGAILLIIYLTYLIKNKKILNANVVLVCLFIISAPSSIYLIYNYMSTGNPVFPYYNEFFKSPFYLLENFKDLRWGPKNLYEYLTWCVYVFFKPDKFSEISAYSGRLSLCFVLSVSAAFIFIIFNKKFKDKCFVLLLIAFISSIFAWEITTGYIRYALFQEIMAGIILSILIANTINKKNNLLKMAGCVISILFLLQISLAYYFIIIRNTDWSWRAETNNYNSITQNLLMIGKDKQELETDALLKDVNAWGIVNHNCAYAAMLKNDIPMFDISYGLINKERIGKDFDAFLNSNIKNKEIYTISSYDQFEETINELNNFGYRIKKLLIIKPAFLPKNEKLYLLNIKKSDEINSFYVLKSETECIEVNLEPEKRQQSLSAVVGFHPVSANWNSDGCWLNIEIENGVEAKRVFKKYIYPKENLQVMNLLIEENYLQGNAKIRFSYSNDEDKNANADRVVILNPYIVIR